MSKTTASDLFVSFFPFFSLFEKETAQRMSNQHGYGAEAHLRWRLLIFFGLRKGMELARLFPPPLCLILTATTEISFAHFSFALLNPFAHLTRSSHLLHILTPLSRLLPHRHLPFSRTSFGSALPRPFSTIRASCERE